MAGVLAADSEVLRCLEADLSEARRLLPSSACRLLQARTALYGEEGESWCMCVRLCNGIAYFSMVVMTTTKMLIVMIEMTEKIIVMKLVIVMMLVIITGIYCFACS